VIQSGRVVPLEQNTAFVDVQRVTFRMRNVLGVHGEKNVEAGARRCARQRIQARRNIREQARDARLGNVLEGQHVVPRYETIGVRNCNAARYWQKHQIFRRHHAHRRLHR